MQAFYFERDDVALPRLGRFFLAQSHEEREHAEGLLRFQTRRGGRVLLQDVKVGCLGCVWGGGGSGCMGGHRCVGVRGCVGVSGLSWATWAAWGPYLPGGVLG